MSSETPVKLVALTGIYAGYEPNEDDGDEIEVLTYDARLHTHVTQTVRPAHSEGGRMFLAFEANDKALRVRLRGATSLLATDPPAVTMVGGKADGEQWAFSRVGGDDLYPEFALEGLDAASFLHHASQTDRIRVEERGGDGRTAEFDATRMTTTPVQPNMHHYMTLEQQKAKSLVLHQLSVPGRRFFNSAKWSFTMTFMRFLTPFLNLVTKLLTAIADRLGCAFGAMIAVAVLLVVSLFLGDQIIDSFNAVVGFVREPTWAILKPIAVGSVVVGLWLVWQVARSELWQDARANSRQRRDHPSDDE